MKLKLSSIFFCLCYLQLVPAQFKLIKNINPNSGSFSAHNSMVVGNKVYFIADNDTTGYEIWSSDGTSNGTKLIKDIFPGNSSCNPTGFGAANNLVFFIADDNQHGNELWRTDDTAPGTFLVYDSKPGASNGSIYVPFNENETFASAAGKIYFLDSNNGLYESDGSTTGTRSVFPIDISYYLISHQNKIYFVGRKSFYDSIYVFNPSTNVTQSTKYDTRHPRDLVSTPLGIFYVDNDYLFFINPSTNIPINLTPANDFFGINIITASGYFNGNFYFTASDRNTGTITNIYKTDGTKAGTTLFLNIGLDNYTSYGKFVPNNNYLFFLFNKSSNDPTELWRTDGTIQGSIKLAEYNSSSLNYITPSNNLIAHNGLIYYFQSSGNRISLYQTDGSINGTKEIGLINDQSTFTQLTTGPMKVGNQLLFSANIKGSNIGEELWSFDLPVKTNEVYKSEEIINIYPNPTQDKIFIDAQLKHPIKYSISDFTGQVMITQGELSSNNTIDLHDLRSGVYLLQLINMSNSKICTIVKM